MLQVIDLNGSPKWTARITVAGWWNALGAFDITDDGTVYALSQDVANSTALEEPLTVFDADGTAKTSPMLPGGNPITWLRIVNGEFFVKRRIRIGSESTVMAPAQNTLFEVYTAGKDGNLQLSRRVAADVKQLTVSYPGPVWTPGAAVPFTIQHDRGRWADEPRFQAWLRPAGTPEFTALPPATGSDGTTYVTPPADARGLYQLRVCPDIAGRYSEYVVDGYVELRPAGVFSTVSILAASDTVAVAAGNGLKTTSNNRFYFGQGEPVQILVVAKADSATALPTTVQVSVLHDGKQVSSHDVALQNGRGTVTISDTQSWQPGRYVLDAVVPGFVVAPHHLEIGAGFPTRPAFHVVQHGDYSPSYPLRRGFGVLQLQDMPDVTADHLARTQLLGISLFVDRIGSFQPSAYQDLYLDSGTLLRVQNDAGGLALEKLWTENQPLRAISGYGAFGVETQGILLGNDAFVPSGTANDMRPPEQVKADLQMATKALAAYPALRGWSWAGNWWVQNKLGANAAISDQDLAPQRGGQPGGDQGGELGFPVLKLRGDPRRKQGSPRG